MKTYFVVSDAGFMSVCNGKEAMKTCLAIQKRGARDIKAFKIEKGINTLVIRLAKTFTTKNI